MMGLWERNTEDLYLDSGVYSMWNRGAGKPDQTKTLPASNSYSTHPLLIARASTKNYTYGVFMNNPAAVDFWLDVS